MAHAYEYQPLSLDSDEIRVLLLWPGVMSDEIKIALFHAGPYRPTYEALSYAWGSSDDPAAITVIKTCFMLGTKREGGREEVGTLQVTRNLEEALRYLRYPDVPRVLWIDALCIDQSNLEERSQQVQNMREIYYLATRIVIWLGPEADDSCVAMQFAEVFGPHIDMCWEAYRYSIHPAELKYPLLNLLSAGESYIAVSLARLFERPWFERLWVVQEVYVASNLPENIVQCGRELVRWDLLRIFLPLISDHFYNQPHLYRHLSMLRSLHCWTPSRLPLRHLLAATDRAKCTDPRDRIYALLGLIHEKDMPIRVDYTIPASRLYKDVFRLCVEYYKSLELLNRCEMGDSPDPSELPTWVPNWARLRLTTTLLGDLEIQGAVPDVTFCSNDVLRVAGVECARIGQCTPIGPPQGQNLLEARDWVLNAWRLLQTDLEDLETTPYVTGRSLLEALCCTLGCHTPPPETDPPGHDFFDLQVSSKDLLSLLSSPGKVDDSTSMKRIYWGRVTGNIVARTFIVTEDRYIGLAPPGTQRGDLVCSFLGCQQPMILRPAAASEKNDSNRFKVVGECYVHGLDSCSAFLGPYPDHDFHVMFDTDTSSGRIRTRHRDEKTGNLSRIDPRLRSSGLFKDEIEPDQYPPVTVDDLKGIGVDMKYFDLI